MFKIAWKILDLSLAYRAFGVLTGAEVFQRRLVTRFLKLSPGDRVLDIGCGPGDWLGYLPEVDYTGIDFNPEYIEAARERWGGRGRFEVAAVGPELVGRYRDYDVVLGLGVLHHLDDAEAASMLDLAAGALKQGGRFVTLDGVLTEDQSSWARYMVLRDRGRFVRTAEAYERLVRSKFECVEVEVMHRQLRIPYSHLVMVCREPRTEK